MKISIPALNLGQIGEDKFESACQTFNLILALTIFSFGWFLYAASPSISAGDSSGLIYAAHHLFFAHPPGYPLFSILGKAWITALPLGHIAYRMNILSAFLTAITILLCCLATWEITTSRIAVFFTMLVLLGSRTTIIYGGSTEVFALNNLFVELFLYTAVRFVKQLDTQADGARITQIYGLWGLLAGLALGNQHIIVLIFPALFLVALLSKTLSWKRIMLTVVFFIIALQIFLFLFFRPVASMIGNKIPSSRDLVNYFLRRQLGTFKLHPGPKEWTIQEAIENNKFFLNSISDELHPLNIGFMVAGLIHLLKQRKILFFYILVTLFMMGPFFFGLITKLPEFTERYWEVLRRFTTDIFPVLATVIGVGVYYFWILLSQRFKKFTCNLLIVSLTVFSLANTTLAMRNSSSRANFVAFDFTSNIYKHLPPNSLLLIYRMADLIGLTHFYEDSLYKRTDVPNIVLIADEEELSRWKKRYDSIILPQPQISRFFGVTGAFLLANESQREIFVNSSLDFQRAVLINLPLEFTSSGLLFEVYRETRKGLSIANHGLKMIDEFVVIRKPAFMSEIDASLYSKYALAYNNLGAEFGQRKLLKEALFCFKKAMSLSVGESFDKSFTKTVRENIRKVEEVQ